MKLSIVHFINPVSFGGQITSAKAGSPSDAMRVGSTPFDIELVESGGFPAVKLSKNQNGTVSHIYVPITNVSGYTPAPAATSAPAPLKK